MAITNADIHAVADRIASEGGSPTLASVRAALGGGSFTTISEGMKAWKAARQAAPAPMREAAPQAVSERMTELASEVWGIAQAMANDRLASEREALEAMRREFEQSQAEAAELADTLADELDEARATIARMSEEAAKKVEVYDAQHAQLVAAQDAARDASYATEAAEEALAESRQRANELFDLLGQEREALKEARAEAKKAAIEAAEMRGKLSDSGSAKS